MDEECWMLTRSNLDRRVWVPMPMGFGEVAHALNAGPLRKVKAYVEDHEPDRDSMEWRRVDEDRWVFIWKEAP